MKSTKKQPGRPAGRVKTAKIEISIEPEVKQQFMTLLSQQGQQASVELGRWIREYIKKQTREVEQ